MPQPCDLREAIGLDICDWSALPKASRIAKVLEAPLPMKPFAAAKVDLCTAVTVGSDPIMVPPQWWAGRQ